MVTIPETISLASGLAENKMEMNIKMNDKTAQDLKANIKGNEGNEIKDINYMQGINGIKHKSVILENLTNEMKLGMNLGMNLEGCGHVDSKVLKLLESSLDGLNSITGRKPVIGTVSDVPQLVSDTDERSDEHLTDDDFERRPQNVAVANIRRDMKQERKQAQVDFQQEVQEVQLNVEVQQEVQEVQEVQNVVQLNVEAQDVQVRRSLPVPQQYVGSHIEKLNSNYNYPINDKLNDFRRCGLPFSTTTSTVANANAIKPVGKGELSDKEFKMHRQQLMTVVVKYLATKIKNSFPPEATTAPAGSEGTELALDKFILILTSRLRLTFNVFVQAMVYLFRYMDIVYLLRYLNQLNNNANCNMQFLVQKLIIGCCRLALYQSHRVPNIDWQRATGLGAREIDSIVLVLTTRMNGKLTVKSVEVSKLKQEILRFVKMVARVK